MGQFFPTAEKFIAKHGFAVYVEQYGNELDDRLWSDAHKDAFGFRPKQSNHYPHPDRIVEAVEIVYAMIGQQIKMDRVAKLSAQYKFEMNVMRLMHRYNFSYGEAVVQIAQAHDCYHPAGGPRGGKIDEGQLLYELGMDYSLENMLRHIMRGEL